MGLKKKHNCEEVAGQLMQLIDGELNAKQEQDVLCEIHRCYHCLEEYNLEKKFKEYLRERLQKERRGCPGTMINELLEKIEAEG